MSRSPLLVAVVLVAAVSLAACSGDEPADPTGGVSGEGSSGGDASESSGVLLTGDSAALSPDGARIAVPCDGELCVWSTADGSLESRFDGGGVVAWSTAGLVATDRVEGGTVSVVVLDAETGAAVAEADAYQAADVQDAPGAGLLDLTFSADGKTLAGVGADGVVRLWPVADLVDVLEVDPAGDAPVAVAFEPDGARLAVASSEAPVSVYDAKSGDELVSLDGDPQSDVAWSPDGRWIAAASFADDDAAATTVWDASTLEVEATLPRAAYRLDFTPSSDALALSEKHQRELLVWSWSDDDLVSLKGATDDPRAVLADSAGLYAVSPRDGVIEWGAAGVVRTFDRPDGG